MPCWPNGARRQEQKAAASNGATTLHPSRHHPKVTPGAKGCEECLKLGWEWFHLRVCRTCGHVGCCDQSRGKHATKHFHHTKHPIIEGYDPPEGWGWCYVDEVMFDLGEQCHAADRPDPALLLSVTA